MRHCSPGDALGPGLPPIAIRLAVTYSFGMRPLNVQHYYDHCSQPYHFVGIIVSNLEENF